MIIFDFDKTLYRKDSLTAFHFFLIRCKPAIALWFPLQVCGAVLYFLRILSTQQFKNLYLLFLTFLTEETIRELARRFWAKEFPEEFHHDLIAMLPEHRSEILIVTASPEIYIEPLLDKLQIRKLIGTRLKRKGARYVIDGKNCKGEEKVKRLSHEFGNNILPEAMYSDSMADLPLFRISKKSFLVSKKGIEEFTP